MAETLPTLLPAPSSILSEKYPSKAHARKVANLLPTTNGTIYLESAPLLLLPDSDSEAPFRQRRPFFYLSGCPLPDSFLTYHIPTNTLTLFIPPVDPESVPWSGLPMSVEEAQAQFDVDEVRHTNDPKPLGAEGGLVYVYTGDGQVSRSLGVSPENINRSQLKPAIDEARVVKDRYEIALLERANEISSYAHNYVLKCAHSMKNEREAQALFEAICLANGATGQAYNGIYAGGRSAATLHYVKNDASLLSVNAPDGGKEKPQLLLVDAGCELRCYASDITRVIPLTPDSKFTQEARQIYDLVLQMQKECMAMVKPHANWEEIHRHAHRVLIQGFLSLGIFKDGSVEEIMDARTSCAFLPHGLGHWLGMDTHDTGGHANYADTDPMFKYLRVRRPLVEGAVVTVEPGVYFCRYIVDGYLAEEKHRKFVDEGVLARYWVVGGVRIEDDVVIEKEGGRSLSLGAVKEREEVEMLAGQRGTPGWCNYL
ncbi:putative Xaa-Pro aminopeptidase [Terfezia boudieri ATCC MYA-4762]|uniref:Xaa-Pro aminopeptidase n=1 Tax=Terfezia boudieri ATCC MYA-4762 TaxID=1051890 RepID=A0A3N4LU64_9PEZI|nr:putative Xaa-Pro aminopeptidase [Terfezia boudieri ATCC MYA-4762]